MTAPDARQSDELRDLIADALYGLDSQFVILALDRLDPVVTAWHEKAAEAQARARAAGELLYAAQVVRIEHGTASTAAKIIDGRADALTADDRPDLDGETGE